MEEKELLTWAKRAVIIGFVLLGLTVFFYGSMFTSLPGHDKLIAGTATIENISAAPGGMPATETYTLTEETERTCYGFRFLGIGEGDRVQFTRIDSDPCLVVEMKQG